MAVLPQNASFQEFAKYVEVHKGPKTDLELEELWVWRQQWLGLRVITGAVARSRLPVEEQHLTLRERENKLVAEAKAQGRNIEKV